ncbi:MAG: hypothetical protein CSA60_02795 [Neptuniibacter caesariensis]|uniref:Uncharacterized protein n=1 Tax=Neptuniibacter caesariensis TaxID=207954 RepID=A0A2G6JN95_NEPCE|nr:MAG: hypothetical protein CSA60_02795 [Neptuniibacter caesariensis]
MYKSLGFALIMMALTPATKAEVGLSDLEYWLKVLPQLFTEQSATGANYVDNFQQCMDDELALNHQEDPSIGQVIDNALNASGACTPLLNEMLEELTGQAAELLSREQKRKILEESL